MKFLDEYRDEALAAKLVDEIRHVVTKSWVLMEVCGGQTHSIVKYGIDRLLRDPTRGGVTSALTEIAQSAKLGMLLDEAAIPISEEVKGACEILGLDPLYVANEGKFIAIVAHQDANRAVETIRTHSLGKHAAVIGEVVDEHAGLIMMKTRVGGMRVVDMLSGEQLPRIC